MLTVGNYETRDGRDVTIVAVDCGVAIGYPIDLGPKHVTTWNARSGRWCNDSNESPFDILDDMNQIKFEKWVTLYREAGGGYYIDVHNLLCDAKLVESTDKVAITKIKIDCTEGENLD